MIAIIVVSTIDDFYTPPGHEMCQVPRHVLRPAAEEGAEGAERGGDDDSGEPSGARPRLC